MKLFAQFICIFLCFASSTPLPAQQQAIIDSLVQVATNTISAQQKVDTYLKIKEEYNHSDSLVAISYLNKAIQLAKEINYPQGTIKALISLGNSCKFYGNYDIALTHYFQAHQLAKDLGDEALVSYSYINIGTIYYMQGNYEKALSFYYRALEVAKQLKDTKQMNAATTGLGIVYRELENYQKALNFHHQALDFALEVRDHLGESIAYGNLGDIYYDNGDYDQSLNYCLQSLKISREQENLMGMSASYNQIGMVYEAQQEYTKAKEYYEASIEMIKKRNARAELSFPLIHIGRVLRKQHQLQLAKKYLNEGIQIAYDKRLADMVKEAAKQLALVEEAQGNYQAAYQAQVLFKQMTDSLRNEALMKRITRLEMEYEFRQTKDSIQFANEAERVILEKDIEYRKGIQIASFISLGLLGISLIILWLFLKSKTRSNRLLTANAIALQKANKEIHTQKEEILSQHQQLQELNSLKDKVFSIIAHDLRSPIDSLQGVLGLFKGNFEVSQAEMKTFMERLSRRVESVSLLLDNLLYWSRSQMKGSLTLVPKKLQFQPYIQEVIQLLMESALAKNIQTKVTLDTPFPSVYIDPEILRFLLRNLLNNAYKFSYTNGEVHIKARVVSATFVKVMIQDQGLGIQEVTKEALFKGFVQSQQGTQHEKGTGLGLMLCKEFIEESGGTIGVENTVEQGSTFWFTLPIVSNTTLSDE